MPSLTNAVRRAVIKTIDPHRWEAAGEPWYGHYGGEATGGGIFALRRPRPYSRRWRGDRRPYKEKRRGTPRRYSLREMKLRD